MIAVSLQCINLIYTWSRNSVIVQVFMLFIMVGRSAIDLLCTQVQSVGVVFS